MHLLKVVYAFVMYLCVSVSILQLIDYLEEFIQVTGKICHKPATNMDINTIYCEHDNSKFKKEFKDTVQLIAAGVIDEHPRVRF